MALTLDTLMLGPVDVTRDTLNARFRGGKYDDGIVDRFASALLAYTATFGLRTSLVAGQIGKETGFFRFDGDVAPEQYNLAGLGATGGGVAGLHYQSIEEGVAAVCAHHAVYLYGAVGNWPETLRPYVELDQRYAAVLSAGKGGTVRAIGDYRNGWWAYTARLPVGSLDNGYAAGIVGLANEMTTESTPTQGGTTVVEAAKEFPDKSDLGFEVRLEPTNFDGGERPLSEVVWGIVHDTEGHFEGDIATLTHNSQAGSVHAIIGREPGQFVASVPIRRSAYTAGNDAVGAKAIQVELSKHTADGETDYTDWQYTALAAFFGWCIRQGAQIPLDYYWPHPPNADGGPLPDVPGFIGHYGVPNPAGLAVTPPWGGKSGHTDPGNEFDWERFMGLMRSATPPGTPTAPQDAGLSIDGIPVGPGVYQLYYSVSADTNARLRIFGLCKTPEHDEYLVIDNPDTASSLKKIAFPVVAVRFERGVIIWDKGRTPPPFDVRVPLASEYVGPADDSLVDAVLKSMQIAQQ